MPTSSEFSVQRYYRRLRGVVRRGVGQNGPDRESLLLIFKSALAATVAWVLANQVLHAPSSTFAPFSALLMVQVTVSRSMDQSTRYAIAVVVGVVLAGLLGPLLGPSVITFVLLMVIALIFGRWRRLGSQGPQVAVAALFAYAAFAQSGLSSSSFLQLLSIAGLVVMGCAIGVIVNLAIFPPVRYRSAEYAVRSLADTVHGFVSDLAEGFREGIPTRDTADDWRDRASQLPGSVTQTRESVEHAAETLRYNPRRLFLRERAPFNGYRTIVNGLGRVTEQLGSVTRGLTYAADVDDPSVGHERFIQTYAGFLDAVAACTGKLGEFHNVEDVRESNELSENVRRCRERFERLSQVIKDNDLDPIGSWPAFGALHTDAHRLVDDFADVQRDLEGISEPSKR